MTARPVPEWQGKRPESMPGKLVLLRLYTKQNGLCACGCTRVMSFERDRIDCDHIVPLKDGGENKEANLQLLLKEHHLQKTVAENSARGEANRHQARAFDRPKPRWPKRGFPPANPKHNATSPIRRRSEEESQP